MADRVAISGNTYQVKEKLKELGGKWDPEKKAWMVPADKAAEAQKLVAATPRAQPLKTASEPRKQYKAPPRLQPGEQFVTWPSKGRGDGYEAGRTYRFSRVKGGGGPDGCYWTATAAGKAKHTQYTDDTREGEWYCWAHVRPATDAEAAPVVEKALATEAKKARKAELTHQLRDSYSAASVVEHVPPDAEVLWQEARMAGSETWYRAADTIYYVRSDYDMGPICWRTTATAEQLAEAKALGLRPNLL